MAMFCLVLVVVVGFVLLQGLCFADLVLFESGRFCWGAGIECVLLWLVCALVFLFVFFLVFVGVYCCVFVCVVFWCLLCVVGLG